MDRLPRPGSIPPGAESLPPELCPNPIQSAAPQPSRLRALLYTLIIDAGLCGFLVSFYTLTRCQATRTLPSTVYRVVLNDAPEAEPLLPLAQAGGGSPKPAEAQPPSAAPAPALPDVVPPDDLPLEPLRTPLEASSLLPQPVQAGAHGVAGGLGQGGGSGSGSGARAAGSSLVRAIRSGEGEVVAIKDVEIKDYVHPAYPALARWGNVRGDVVIRVTIDERGRVVQHEIQSGEEVFYPEIEKVLPKWRFLPVRRNGVPVRATFEIIIRFSLLVGA